MKKITLGLTLLFGATLLAQSSPVKYEPTEVELLRLQVAQKDAQIAQMQLQQAQQIFQQSFGRLRAEADKIKAEHKWPAEVQFKSDTLTFAAPPPKEPEKPKVPEKKP